MSKLSAPPTYYPALTGVRALAAFAVFGFHHRHSQAVGHSGLVEALRAVLGELHIGVSVFFTLSGYLITRRYAGQSFGTAAWGRYLAHRAARIGPVYWVLVTVTFAVHYFDQGQPAPGHWLGLYLANITLVKGLVESWLLTGIAQAWSLTVEEGFYLLAPVIFWLGWRYGPGRAWPWLAVGLALLGWGIYSVPMLGTPLFMLKATIFGRLTEFLLGAAFAWYAPRLGQRGATVLGVIGMALVLALLVAVQLRIHLVSIDSYLGVSINNLLLPVVTACLLHGLATEATPLAWVLGTAFWQHLGRASYCFYLLHMGLLPDALTPLLRQYLPGSAAVGALFGALVVASLALHRYVEKPAHRWLLARLAPMAHE